MIFVRLAMATTSTVCDFGAPAVEFDLPGTDGKRHGPVSARGPGGLLVMFICNHCPYVKAIRHKLVRDCAALLAHGVGSIAVMSNDTIAYPDDDFEAMRRTALEFAYPFPYVLDETQDVARAYGAVCTPEFFGYDRDLRLQYHGRLDAAGRGDDPQAPRELFDAMVAIAAGRPGPRDQVPAIGCSIKWRPS
jgi:peroxiredoxin